MKTIFLSLVITLATHHCFSQIPTKKQIPAQPTYNTQKVSESKTQAPKETIVLPEASTRKAGTKIIPGSKYSIQPKPDYAKATLVDTYIYVTTGGSTSNNKDADTHWSCGTFDQVGNSITSFHDDSNHDAYGSGSKKTLQMKIDRVAALGDFQNLGRLHINIASNGNDTWIISEFTLVMDFDNPKLQQKLTWYNVGLNQDHADIDLYFHFDGARLIVNQN